MRAIVLVDSSDTYIASRITYLKEGDANPSYFTSA
jgi:hypothetical protein